MRDLALDLSECGPGFCDSQFVVPLDLEGTSVIRLSFETLNNSLDDLDVDDWSLVFLEGPKTALIMKGAQVAGCWGAGAEVLIASHTTAFDGGQVRTLVSTPVAVGDGLVRLDLDRPILPPATTRNSDGFAVEVALLSRNIVLEGARDESDSLLGGHLVVFRTPDVVQKLDGVDIRRQGYRNGR